ncbi:MAG: serine hydrolase [Chitinophagales bacterium]|nr:serine hydrolase [Chitinophagales bacterium]
MYKLSVACIFFAVCNLLSMESTGQTVPIATKLIGHYNSENYDSLYMMLAADFQKEFSRKDHHEFYKTNIRPYGNALSVKPISAENGIDNYKVTFEKGDLKLSLLMGRNNLIQSLQWLPYQAEEIIKRDASTVNTNNPHHSGLQLLIDSVTRKFFENPVNCGLSIGIIQDGKTETYFYGETKRGTGILPDIHTQYEIGSITKTFTGLLLAKAVSAGKLSLDDEIRKFLPEGLTQPEMTGKPVLVKHLASHCSGLPANPTNLTFQKDYDPNDPFRNYDSGLFIEFLKNSRPDTIPGTVFTYSNTGVGLLGMILANIYNKPFEELCVELILKPFSMKESGFNTNDSAITQLATGYRASNGKATPYWNWKYLASAGGLKSSLNDMILYLNNQINSTSKEIALSQQPVFTDSQQAVGLNWFIVPYKNMNFIFHDGRTSGFSSVCGFVKERKTGIVVLNNSGIDCSELAFAIMRELLK